MLRFSGHLLHPDGTPRTGIAGVMFSLYKQQQGGAALWTELQNVQLDANGNYTVLLGAQHSDGVPAELFTTNDARWLGIQVEADAEQPRILLVSVPYALKAGDAETLGGLPASAFVQAMTTANGGGGTAGGGGGGGAEASAAGTIVPYSVNTSTSGGTAGYVARWSDASTLGNSLLYDNGTNLGIGTTSPAAALDIQTNSATPTNALNVASTLTNSTANSGVVTALNLRVTDLSTGTNVSKQTMRMSYIRDAAATGGVSVFDTIFTATPIINSDAPYTLIGLNMEAPNVAAGKTLATFYGALIGAGGSSGTVTNRYALATAPGSGNVGLNTTTPIAPLNLVADNPGGAERASQFVVQGSTNPNLKLNIGLHTEASPAYADLSAVEENVAWRNIVLEKNGGFVGIGTTTPTNKLTVAGTIESTTGGIKFPDASVQTTSGIPYVSGCTSGNVLGWNGSNWVCTAVAASGGTITALTAGSGLLANPSTITTTGTLSANFTTTGGDNGSASTVARGDHLHDGRYVQISPQSFTYSNASVKGRYAFSLIGVMPGSTSGTIIVFSEVGYLVSDGAGHITSGSFNEYTSSGNCQGSLSGTYSVNSAGQGTVNLTASTSSYGCVGGTSTLNGQVSQQGSSVVFAESDGEAWASGTAIRQ